MHVKESYCFIMVLLWFFSGGGCVCLFVVAVWVFYFY